MPPVRAASTTRPLGLAGRNFTTETTYINAYRTMNLIPRPVQINPNMVSVLLLPTPGLLKFVDLATGVPIRGLFVRSDGNLIAVSGTGVYSITSGGVATLQTGAVSNTANAHVEIFENLGGQVLIRADTNGYILSGTTVTQIASNFPANCAMVDFVDQYFIALDGAAGQKIWFSNINDGTTWGATSYFLFDTDVETLVDVFVNRNEIFVLGQDKTVIYYDSGQTLNPFLKRPGGIIQYGCAAKESTAKVGNDFFFLASGQSGSGVAIRVRGYEASKISDYRFEETIRSYGSFNDAIGFGLRQDGLDLYWLYFPTANATWVYDNTNGLWHERGQWDGTGWNAHRAGCHAFFNNQHVVGDINSGLIYAMDRAYTTDNGARIRRLRQAPYPTMPTNDWIYHDEVDVRFDVTNAPDNPIFTLNWSEDEGETFDESYRLENYPIRKKSSKSRQALGHKLGRSYGGRVYQLITDEPIHAIHESFIKVH